MCGSDPYKPYHFLKECKVNFQIHINCFNRLRFLAEVRTKLKKCAFLDNLRTITQERNMEAGQMTPSFSFTFSALTVCDIPFVLENSQNSFSCDPHILVCKIPQLWAKSYRFGRPSYFSRKQISRGY